MKQTDKELLMKDLYGKLPYKTYVKTAKGIGYVYALNNSQLVELSVANDSEYWSEVFNIDKIKPYLRPMSSMIEEEENEYRNIDNRSYSCPIEYAHIPASDRIDWLNAHHFDYRNLISKGLALEAPEEMYNVKEQ